MRTALAATAAVLSVGAVSQAQAQEVETFATNTHSMIRGSVPGNFAGFYGGNFPGVFPVALTDAQARSAILGGPDGAFVSLPGMSGTPPGTAFPGAYVEVSFGFNFGTDATLSIWELGNNAESAQVFLWTNNGGNVQFTFTRGTSDETSFDLSSYAGVLTTLGATSFTRVGIGGLDVSGDSRGFDLDAVSITTPVPEPSTYALMLIGLGAVGWMKRRRQSV